MGLFSRRQRDNNAAFDLASLDLPRIEPQGEDDESTLSDLGVMSPGPVNVAFYQGIDELGAQLAPMSPFFFAPQGRPTVVMRLDGLTGPEEAELVEAVKEDACLLRANYHSYSRFPVLSLILSVYSEGKSREYEGIRDITIADIQDFIVALCRNGGRGRVRLYAGPAVSATASGHFALCFTPEDDPLFPHSTDTQDVHELWGLLNLGAVWLSQIPTEHRDFRAAVRAHLDRSRP